jgi:hypothetical protein
MRGGGADGDGGSKEGKEKKEMYSWADQRVDDHDDCR